ncbi:conserved hypothetical protein [Ricinus communis]|uniref:Uncharacterized protein n=1 Tax=Ricinus communis TaxID=3988 RepID=B9STF5_RICCO|nr:conserved hypothetical protein [Ricinus communis]
MAATSNGKRRRLSLSSNVHEDETSFYGCVEGDTDGGGEGGGNIGEGGCNCGKGRS